ncbi:MAG: NACHT domain-containing protein [Chloroflexi bacterium]|nr:NACHT domain-containing protein [Chloroflexota bacterium]
MPDPIAITAVLGLITSKVLDTLADKGMEKAADAAMAKLQGDKVKNAFRLALGEAIRRYATVGTRFTIAAPLLAQDGPLTEQSVAEELAQILRFDREPNYRLIGDRWKASIENPPKWIDFTSQAEIFANCLRDELKASEVFGVTMERRMIDGINDNVAVLVEALHSIVDDLNELCSMMDAPISELILAIAGSSFRIQEQARDFTWYIKDKTRDFVGRQFVFDRVNAFTQANPQGYFIVRGDPGIGKTALAAQWVKTHKSPHHFNIRSIGINNSEVFLRNICAQLIAAYKLEHYSLPPDIAQDGGFLIHLMNEVSEKLETGERVVIVIDALDEVEDQGSISGRNLLCLPHKLPKGVYILVTTRRTDLHMRIECEQETLDIEQNQKENIEDVKLYIESKLGLFGIQKYLIDQGIDKAVFVESLAEKSQGNFMYLTYILRDINHGVYEDTSLEKLPIGLTNYYEDHWGRMRQHSETGWLTYKLPIVIALSIVREPVSIELISAFSNVKDYRQIRSVLLEWQQFLYEQKIVCNEMLQKRWRLYHDSFREFIASKDEVEGEHVSLRKAYGIMVDAVWSDEAFSQNSSA